MNPQEQEFDRIARKRAGAKMGWYIHAFVYLAVNALLATLSAASGKHWAVFPAFGWGIGLAAHGIAVFMLSGAGGLQERMVRRERERLQLQRDPW
jgi:hypothetical protein